MEGENMKKPEKWWEYLDWNKMKNTWWRLTEDVRNEIREAGLAPDFDNQSSKESAMNENNMS